MEASTLQARVLEKLQATGQPTARGSASSRLPTQTVSNRRRQVSESSSSEDGFGYSSSDSESDKELRLDVRSTQADILKASRICSRRDLTNCLRKRRRLLQISLAALIVTALSFVAFAAYELEQTEQLGGSLQQQAAPRWRTDDLPQEAWLAAGWGLPPVMRESRPGDGLRSNNSTTQRKSKCKIGCGAWSWSDEPIATLSLQRDVLFGSEPDMMFGVCSRVLYEPLFGFSHIKVRTFTSDLSRIP
ncbi:Arl10 [Symbiodinium sp. CCMP2456]|nr:Arl10 [Symbiodinium sp. CCMP2456]